MRSSTFDLLQDLNFKIQMKDLQLRNYELNLKEFESELMEREQDLIKARHSLNEELNYQRGIIEQEMEEIRINYQNEFQYVVDKEVKVRLRQLQNGATPKSKGASTQYSASDMSMGMTPSPSKQQQQPHSQRQISREWESPVMSRRPLQLINDDTVASKKYTKASPDETFSIPKTNALLTKNAKLFEKAQVFHDDANYLPSPFLRRFNNADSWTTWTTLLGQLP